MKLPLAILLICVSAMAAPVPPPLPTSKPVRHVKPALSPKQSVLQASVAKTKVAAPLVVQVIPAQTWVMTCTFPTAVASNLVQYAPDPRGPWTTFYQVSPPLWTGSVYWTTNVTNVSTSPAVYFRVGNSGS